jgi:hypothetical protein
MRFQLMMNPKDSPPLATTARHIAAAQKLIKHQKDIIHKFGREGLDTTTEQYLLDALRRELMMDEARMGRLLYEGGARVADRPTRRRRTSWPQARN